MMTTELVLLLGMFVFILFGVFLGDRGPMATYKKSAPRLAAKIEKDITIGRGFAGGSKLDWQK